MPPVLSLLFFLFLSVSASHFHLRSPPFPSISSPQQYLDPTFPSITLPSPPPSFSLPLLSHSFAYTYNLPPVTARYFAPSSPFDLAVLHLEISSKGNQYDRIAAIWLDGIELLRTSTAQPTESGIYWSVRKDVSSYSSLLKKNGTLSVMLENIFDETYTGVYHVNVSLDFYENAENANPVKPADLIIPISEEKDDTGFWFRIQNGSDVRFTELSIPSNTLKAVLEIYVSFHDNDEFWYMNPPDSYIKQNNLTTQRGNGAFRELFVTLDQYYAGSIVPFPVIFTGGINPLFWEPVVGLGAFNLPTYTLELTPFLGIILEDNKSHKIGLGVTDAISFWLVDANLHLWLDPNSDFTSAKLVNYQAENTFISRDYVIQSLNGTFIIEASRESHFSGWVNSSFGNFTTEVSNNLKFNSSVQFSNNGDDKFVLMNTNQKRVTKTLVGEKINKVISKETIETKYPIEVITKTIYGENNSDPYTLITNLSHVLYEERYHKLDNVVYYYYLIDKQEGDGWMVVQDHDVLSGSVGTEQSYEYGDDDLVYRRVVRVKDAVILSDNTTETENLGHSIW